MNYSKLYLKDNEIWDYQGILSTLNFQPIDLSKMSVVARLGISNIIYVSNEKHV